MALISIQYFFQHTILNSVFLEEEYQE